MNNNDKKVLELIVFWLAVAHSIVSVIMTWLNCGKGKNSGKQQKRSKSQKGKGDNIVDKSMECLQNLMSNNCNMWIISTLICIAIAIITGFCIWGDNDDDNDKK